MSSGWRTLLDRRPPSPVGGSRPHRPPWPPGGGSRRDRLRRPWPRSRFQGAGAGRSPDVRRPRRRRRAPPAPPPPASRRRGWPRAARRSRRRNRRHRHRLWRRCRPGARQRDGAWRFSSSTVASFFSVLPLMPQLSLSGCNLTADRAATQRFAHGVDRRRSFLRGGRGARAWRWPSRARQLANSRTSATLAPARRSVPVSYRRHHASGNARRPARSRPKPWRPAPAAAGRRRRWPGGGRRPTRPTRRAPRDGSRARSPPPSRPRAGGRTRVIAERRDPVDEVIPADRIRCRRSLLRPRDGQVERRVAVALVRRPRLAAAPLAGCDAAGGDGVAECRAPEHPIVERLGEGERGSVGDRPARGDHGARADGHELARQTGGQAGQPDAAEAAAVEEHEVGDPAQLAHGVDGQQVLRREDRPGDARVSPLRTRRGWRCAGSDGCRRARWRAR